MLKTSDKLGAVFISLIACTSNCVYQLDGYCSLARVASCGMPCFEESCINFVPRRSVYKSVIEAQPMPHGYYEHGSIGALLVQSTSQYYGSGQGIW